MFFRKGFQTKILCNHDISVNICDFKESIKFGKRFCERFKDNRTIFRSEESYLKVNVSCCSVARLRRGFGDERLFIKEINRLEEA